MIARVAQTLSKNFRSANFPAYFQSSTKSINQPTKFQDNSQALKDNIWREVDPTHTKSAISHQSNGEVLIHQIPVLMSSSQVVRCMGGSMPGAGHPMIYIQLNTRKQGEAVPCKYCGLRYCWEGHH